MLFRSGVAAFISRRQYLLENVSSLSLMGLPPPVQGRKYWHPPWQSIILRAKQCPAGASPSSLQLCWCHCGKVYIAHSFHAQRTASDCGPHPTYYPDPIAPPPHAIQQSSPHQPAAHQNQVADHLCLRAECHQRHRRADTLTCKKILASGSKVVSHN